MKARVADSPRSSAPTRADFSDGSLVTTSISQTGRFEVFPRSLRVVRPGTGRQDAMPPDRSGQSISGFSDKSRSRLRFAALNAFPALTSQLALTYHDTWPTDGRQCKRHLGLFLDLLRRWCPGINYLWLLEFQKRNAPHFHLFLSIPPDADLWRKLAQAWVTISGGTSEALWWHGPERGQNWIPWDMGNGGYLCKYLDKEAQKSIPDDYHSFGRFWGHNRGLVPESIKISLDSLAAYDQLNKETGEVKTGESYLIRQLGRLAEKQTNGYSKFRKRAPYASYTVLNGAAAFFQLERYLSKGGETKCKKIAGGCSSAPPVGKTSGPIR